MQICEICGRKSQQEGWLRGYGKDAIPSYICVNLCYLWETLLYKKLLCVPWVLWDIALPRIALINTDGWLR